VHSRVPLTFPLLPSQNYCWSEFNLGNSDVEVVRGFLAASKMNLMQISQLPPQSQLTAVQQLMAANYTSLLGSMSILAQRSLYGSFSQTAATDCSQFFVFPWIATGIQAFATLILVLTLPSAYKLRFANSIVLILGASASLPNIATAAYLKPFLQNNPATQKTYTFALVFTAGCIGVAILDIFYAYAAALFEDPSDKDYSSQYGVGTATA
jgi:hypothetical protein